MVLKEACDVLNQLNIRLHKVLIQRRYVKGIGRSSVLEKHLKFPQLEDSRFSLIRKVVRDDGKGHLRILEKFL